MPKEDTNLLRNEMPWLKPQNNPKIRVSYDVYFGKVTSNDLIVWLLGQLGLSPEETAIENDSSITCLCALKLDQDGRYVAGSFALSSFVWAIGSLANARSIGAKLDASKLDEIQTVIDSKLMGTQEGAAPLPLSQQDLDSILALSCEKTMIAPSLIETSLWSRRKEQHANKAGEFPTLNPTTELMQSFYLKDLARIKTASTDNVDNYVQAMIEERPNRIQIDTDVVQMQYCLRAEAFPLGVWPSRNSPSLMQQLRLIWQPPASKQFSR